MNAAEKAQVRDLIARNLQLEKENKRLRALLKATSTVRQQAVDEARRLHGILMMHGIEVRE